ncbi:MAG: 50S ribosomal protein L25 [Patescibacteria group bacterium]
MEKVQLKAKARDVKNNLKKLRTQGEVPGVLYGHNVKNENLTVKKGDFEKTLKKAGESTIVDLITEDGKTHPVLIHDVQLHYLTSEPIHVDFYQVSMTEKLKAKVALEFSGEAPAVKTMGGVLVKNLNEVEVQCLPADLPHNIPVDISSLINFSKNIHVRDLKVSDKVQIITPADETVAKVQPPRDVEAELAAVPVDEKAAVEAAVAASEKPKAEGEEGEAEKGKADEKPVKEEKAKKE